MHTKSVSLNKISNDFTVFHPVPEHLLFQMEQERSIIIKAVVIGDMAVGKTSLLRQYVKHEFSNSTTSTIGIEFFTKKLVYDDVGSELSLQLWDTAGQERFSSIINSFFRDTHLVIFAYAVNNRDSFAHIENWMKEARWVVQDASENVWGNDFTRLGLLLANKIDVPQEERVVTEKEGRQFAENHGMHFHEVSAKTRDGVQEAFASLTKHLTTIAQDIQKSTPNTYIDLRRSIRVTYDGEDESLYSSTQRWGESNTNPKSCC